MTADEFPSADRLRERLAAFEDRTSLLRVVAALNYRHGVEPARIAAMYGVSERTVYNWVDRFAERPLEEAVHDRPRPGRPPALTPDQRESLAAAVSDAPAGCGYDADEWTAALLRRHVRERFGVDYSERHAARLLDRLRAPG